VDVFSVTAGSLAYVTSTVISNVTGSSPNGVTVNPTGQYLLVTDNDTAGDGLIEVFAIDPTLGTLTEIPDSPFASAGVTGVNATSVVVDPTDTYVYATNQFNPSNGLVGFTINTGTGATAGDLTALTNSGAAQATDAANSVVIDPQDRYVFVANVGNTDGTVSGWTIDTGGALTALPANPYSIGTGAVTSAVAISPAGQFLYAADSANDKLAGFSLNQTAGPTLGVPTALTGGPVATGAGPGPVAVDPSGRFVYVGNINDPDISGYAAGPATGVPAGGGVLTNLNGGTPFAFAGAGTNAFAIF
jgi:6-phosphogluconolactonase (cycloisomerase 2 family)